ncbi:IS66 family insertion sequence element accessory protein TnpB [Robinsoniella peoriensis]
MLGDVSGISKKTGKTDMRRSIDGLMAIIRDTYQMDPYANALYLFCGKRCNTIKALYFDKDGFCLIYKRLDSEGRFQWPRNAVEVRAITRQEFRWLMEGLSIEQPKAIRPVPKNSNKVFLFVHYRENEKFMDDRFYYKIEVVHINTLNRKLIRVLQSVSGY